MQIGVAISRLECARKIIFLSIVANVFVVVLAIKYQWMATTLARESSVLWCGLSQRENGLINCPDFSALMSPFRFCLLAWAISISCCYEIFMLLTRESRSNSSKLLFLLVVFPFFRLLTMSLARVNLFAVSARVCVFIVVFFFKKH